MLAFERDFFSYVSYVLQQLKGYRQTFGSAPVLLLTSIIVPLVSTPNDV